MATYQIHRLKAHLRQQFRYAPHVSGLAQIKPRDYELGSTVEAVSPYAAFFALKETEAPLEVGDVLDRDGILLIFKFVGFEDAAWIVPELKSEQKLDGIPNTAEPQASAVLH